MQIFRREAKNSTIYVHVYYQRQQAKKLKNFQKPIELLRNCRLKLSGRLCNYTLNNIDG